MTDSADAGSTIKLESEILVKHCGNDVLGYMPYLADEVAPSRHDRRRSYEAVPCMARTVRCQFIDRPDGTFCALVLFEPDRLYRCEGFGSLTAAEGCIEGLRIIWEACGATVEPSHAIDDNARGSARDLREWAL